MEEFVSRQESVRRRGGGGDKHGRDPKPIDTVSKTQFRHSCAVLERSSIRHWSIRGFACAVEVSLKDSQMLIDFEKTEK